MLKDMKDVVPNGEQLKVQRSAFIAHHSSFRISSVRLKLKQVQLFTNIQGFGFIGKVGKPL
jgi:hypothetical protein